MRKEIILIALFICIVAGSHAAAQTRTSFGVKLNAGLTNLTLTDMSGVTHSFNPAASVGGFTSIQFTKHFILQPELVFNYMESTVKYSGQKTKFKYAGVEIPVYALTHITAGTGKVIIGAGPHVGYGFSADTAIEKLPQGAPGENVIEMDHWYAGGGVQAGYEFRNGILLQSVYQLSYDLRSGKNRSQVRTQTISVGIGYRF
ncbi:MAG: PorT family protein [Tannerellaceae bacterium]|nr:PorT family protein [Tannerellaceae bacterium]